MSSAKLNALHDNLAQLSKSLDELKQQSVELNNRIDATQRQLSAVRARIASLNERGPVALDTGETRASTEPVEPSPPGQEGARDQAGKSFTRNLLVAAFIIFVAIYIYSLWKKRQSEETPSEQDAEAETEGSATFTYPPRSDADGSSGEQAGQPDMDQNSDNASDKP